MCGVAVFCFVNENIAEYELKLSEIRIETSGGDLNAPFIELYNPSVDIFLSDLEFSGVVTGSVTNDSNKILAQGYYLVIYDASSGNNVSCSHCNCGDSSNLNSRYCNNAIYIGCNDVICTFDGSYVKCLFEHCIICLRLINCAIVFVFLFIEQ